LASRNLLVGGRKGGFMASRGGFSGGDTHFRGWRVAFGEAKWWLVSFSGNECLSVDGGIFKWKAVNLSGRKCILVDGDVFR
jgi:hypothetical protein